MAANPAPALRSASTDTLVSLVDRSLANGRRGNLWGYSCGSWHIEPLLHIKSGRAVGYELAFCSSFATGPGTCFRIGNAHAAGTEFNCVWFHLRPTQSTDGVSQTNGRHLPVYKVLILRLGEGARRANQHRSLLSMSPLAGADKTIGSPEKCILLYRNT